MPLFQIRYDRIWMATSDRTTRTLEVIIEANSLESAMDAIKKADGEQNQYCIVRFQKAIKLDGVVLWK